MAAGGRVQTGKRGWVELPDVGGYLAANPDTVTPAQKTKLLERFKGALLVPAPGSDYPTNALCSLLSAISSLPTPIPLRPLLSPPR